MWPVGCPVRSFRVVNIDELYSRRFAYLQLLSLSGLIDILRELEGAHTGTRTRKEQSGSGTTNKEKRMVT